MPIRSKAQFKYIMAKRSKYGSKSETPEKDKWVWDKDFDPETTDFDQLSWKAPKDPEKKKANDEKVASIRKKIEDKMKKKGTGPQYKKAINKIKNAVEILEEEFFNTINEISAFEEYKEEAEYIDKVYVNLVEDFNDYNSDLHKHTTNLVEYLNEEEYSDNNFEFYTEDVSNLSNLFIQNFLKMVAQNPQMNKKDFESLVDNFVQDDNIIDKWKTDLTKKLKTVYVNKNEQELLSSVDDYIKKYEELDAQGRLEMFLKDLHQIDDSDHIFILKELKEKPKELQAIRTTFSKIEPKGDFFSGTYKTIFDLLKNIVYEKPSIANVEEAEIENKNDIKLTEIYSFLVKSGLLEYIRKILYVYSESLDYGIKEAEDFIGIKSDQSGGNNSQKMIAQERQGKIIQAKIETLAYVTIFCILYFVSKCSADRWQAQKENKGTNNKEQELENKAEVIEENINFNEVLMNIYTEDIKEYLEFTVRPIRFAINYIVKANNILSFQALTNDKNTFAKYVSKYFYATSYSLNKLQTISKQIGMPVISQEGIVDTLQSAMKNGVDNKRRNFAKRELIKNVLGKRQFITRLIMSIMKEYGVKQSFGAKLGVFARNKVDAFKDTFKQDQVNPNLNNNNVLKDKKGV